MSEIFLKSWVDFKKNHDWIDLKNLQEFCESLERKGYQAHFPQALRFFHPQKMEEKEEFFEDNGRFFEIEIFKETSKENQKIEINKDDEYNQFTIVKKNKIAEIAIELIAIKYYTGPDIKIHLKYLKNVEILDVYSEYVDDIRIHKCGKYYYTWYDPIKLYENLSKSILKDSLEGF